MAGMPLWDAQGFEERHQFPVWMEIPGSERDGALTMTNQSAGSRSDRCQPIGNILRIADRSREEQQFSLGWAENDGLLPDDASFRVCDIL